MATPTSRDLKTLIIPSQETDRLLYEHLLKLSKQDKVLPNYGALGEPLRLSRKRIAASLERLEKAKRVKTKTVSFTRHITLLETGGVVKIAKRVLKTGQWNAKRTGRIIVSQIPPEAQSAIDLIRRIGPVCYAERTDDNSTRLTGFYVVGQRCVSLDELIAIAEKAQEKLHA